MAAWDGSGDPWESSWRHLGPKTAQSSKKGRFWPSPGSPRGTLLGAFLAPFPLWVFLGTLKWWSLGGVRFDITFLIKFWSKLEAFWTLQTLIICVRGCKYQVLGYVGFWTILGTMLEVILEPKLDPKSHCDSLWAPSVAILTLFWEVEKSDEKKDPKKSCKNHPGPAGAGLWLP